MSDKEKLKAISKRIRKAIDNDEDDLLYVLFDIQDIIQVQVIFIILVFSNHQMIY